MDFWGIHIESEFVPIFPAVGVVAAAIVAFLAQLIVAIFQFFIGRSQIKAALAAAAAAEKNAEAATANATAAVRNVDLKQEEICRAAVASITKQQREKLEKVRELIAGFMALAMDTTKAGMFEPEEKEKINVFAAKLSTLILPNEESREQFNIDLERLRDAAARNNIMIANETDLRSSFVLNCQKYLAIEEKRLERQEISGKLE